MPGWRCAQLRDGWYGGSGGVARCECHFTMTAPPADRRSFKAFTQPGHLPEAEWRQGFAGNPDSTVGQSLMSLDIRWAITVDARMKPNSAGIGLPVLAIYQAQRAFEEVPAEFDIHNEEKRAALRQQYAATRAVPLATADDVRLRLTTRTPISCYFETMAYSRSCTQTTELLSP